MDSEIEGSLFSELRNLETISNIEYLDVSQVSNFSYFFNNCISLTDVGNIKKWNTSKAIDMSYMFSWTNISKLDLGEWDTSKVIKMNEMFYSPSRNSLTQLNLSNWDTRNVEDMSFFLSGNVNLQSLTLGPNMVFKDYYDIFLYDSLFFTTRWMGLNSNYIFDDINTLLNDYDGNYPDTYIREKSKISETILDSDGWKILPSGEWIYVQDSAVVTGINDINDKRYFFLK